MNTVHERIRGLCKKLDIKFILPAADHPGMHRVYSNGKPMGELFPAAVGVDAVITVSNK